MRVALEKVDGVEAVSVSLNDGLARIQLKAANPVTIGQLREAVERNGFTPRAATVTVRAEVITAGGQLQLKVTGTKEVLAVADTPETAAGREAIRKQVGRTVLVDGVIPPPNDRKTPLLIQVAEVRPAGA